MKLERTCACCNGNCHAKAKELSEKLETMKSGYVSYTKDYSGKFPESGPLERINITINGETVFSISPEFLKQMAEDCLEIDL